MKRFLLVFAALIAVLLVRSAASQAPAPAYSVYNVGAYAAGAPNGYSTAYSLNNSGQVTGTSSVSNGIFVWNLSSPTTSFLVAPYSGGNAAAGYAISPTGLVAGYSLDDTGIFNSQQSYAITTNGSGLFSLSKGSASGINAYGQVTGQQVDSFTGATTAFLWQPSVPGGGGGTMVGLGTLGGSSSYGHDINAGGAVVGGANLSSGLEHAFLWTPTAPNGTTGAMVDLAMTPQGQVHPWASFQNTAYGMNDVGQVVGETYVSPSGTRPFIWDDIDQQMTALDSLGSTARATSINSNGIIVGYYDPGTGQHAFIWDPTVGSMVDLNSKIAAGSGWVLQAAYDINDKGQIVGAGTFNGVGRGFLLDPAPTLYLSSVTVTPASVTGGAGATGRATLSMAAPAGGLTVSLASDTPGAASVPATVTIPAGQSSATFPISTTPQAVDTDVLISGTYAGQARGAVLTVLAPVPTALTLDNPSVTAGGSVTGTVTLTGPAPTGGLVVALSANNVAATVPATVTVPAGQSNVTFPVSTSGVTSPTTVTLTATFNQVSASGSLLINPIVPVSLTLSPSTLLGGSGRTTTATVTLNGAALAGGQVVTLSSGLSVAITAASITVPQGQTSTTFTVTLTNAVALDQSGPIYATCNGTAASATLTVQAPTPTAVFLLSGAPTTVGGKSLPFAVQLNGPAPSPAGLDIPVAAAGPVVFSGTVHIPAGQTTSSTSTPYTVSLTAVAQNTPGSLTASYDPDASGPRPAGAATLNFNILAPTPTALTVDQSEWLGGASRTGTVTISGPAPSGGLLVNLASSDPSVSVPTTATVPAGATSVTFPISSSSVATTTTVTLTASYDPDGAGSLAPVSATTVVTVDAPVPGALTLALASVYGGFSTTGTVTITGAAPAGGLTLQLSASDPSVTVPATVTVLAGQTSASFTVSTSSVLSTLSVTVSASYDADGAGSQPPVVQSATLQVKRAELRGLSFTPSNVVTGGSTTTLVITLTSPAPAGGSVVNLSSSDKYTVPVPGHATVPAGASSTTVSITTRKPKSGQATAVTVTGVHQVTNGLTRTATITVQ